MYITIGGVFGGDSKHFDILGHFLKIWSFLIKQLTIHTELNINDSVKKNYFILIFTAYQNYPLALRISLSMR